MALSLLSLAFVIAKISSAHHLGFRSRSFPPRANPSYAAISGAGFRGTAGHDASYVYNYTKKRLCHSSTSFSPHTMTIQATHFPDPYAPSRRRRYSDSSLEKIPDSPEEPSCHMDTSRRSSLDSAERRNFDDSGERSPRSRSSSMRHSIHLELHPIAE